MWLVLARQRKKKWFCKMATQDIASSDAFCPCKHSIPHAAHATFQIGKALKIVPLLFRVHLNQTSNSPGSEPVLQVVIVFAEMNQPARSQRRKTAPWLQQVTLRLATVHSRSSRQPPAPTPSTGTRIAKPTITTTTSGVGTT